MAFSRNLSAFNGLQFKQGTEIVIDVNQAQYYDRLSPNDSVIVSVALHFSSVKAIIRKSQIQVML